MNPGTDVKDKLPVYRELGINRLSMGLQSADNEELKCWDESTPTRISGRYISGREGWIYQYQCGSHVGNSGTDAGEL